MVNRMQLSGIWGRRPLGRAEKEVPKVRLRFENGRLGGPYRHDQIALCYLHDLWERVAMSSRIIVAEGITDMGMGGHGDMTFGAFF